MNKFTASNGVIVWKDEDGSVYTSRVDGSYFAPDDTQALREFFLHERDQELGRGRWPENPYYVVYQDEDGYVSTVHELFGVERGSYSRDGVDGGSVTDKSVQAARAFFAAHPEPKPWHDAKPGEVWVIELEDGTECAATREHGVDFKLSYGNLMSPRDERIVAGRRIWPEG